MLRYSGCLAFLPLTMLPFGYYIMGNLYHLEEWQIAFIFAWAASMSLAVGGVVLCVRHFFGNRAARSLSALSGAAMFMIFTYRFFGLDKYLYIAVALCMPVGLCWLFYRSKTLSEIASSSFFVMCIVAFLQILVMSVRFDGAANYETDKLSDLSAEFTPNIYTITLDAYSRSDELLLLGHDNSNFESELEGRNFFIARAARSNFVTTDYSMFTLWNMEYPRYDGVSVALERREAVQTMFGKNRVVSSLRSLGYQIVRMGPNRYKPTDCSGLEDLCLFQRKAVDGKAYGSAQNMGYEILRMTPLAKVGAKLFPKLNDKAAYYKSSLEDGRRSLEEKHHLLTAPYFVDINVWQPHPPYIFDQDCDRQLDIVAYQDTWEHTNPLARAHYLEEIKCANTQVVRLVDQIIENDTSAIIVIQSDHGHGFFTSFDQDTSKWSNKSTNARTSILWAARVPAECSKSLYHTITPVNTFRMIFACMSGEFPRFLVDKTFVHDEKYVKFRKVMENLPLAKSS